MITNRKLMSVLTMFLLVAVIFGTTACKDSKPKVYDHTEGDQVDSAVDSKDQQGDDTNTQKDEKTDKDNPVKEDPSQDKDDSNKDNNTDNDSDNKGETMEKEAAKGYVISEEATNYIDIQMDSGNHIVVEIMPDKAPLTVANFQKLVGSGFYNDLIFHRIIKGFMIQGGDPQGTGMGGADETIKGEFTDNGVNNDISHERGVISMARSQDNDSASSQFFICHADSQFLDGHYAAFGKVVFGMEEVDRLAELKTGSQDRPATPPVMKNVFFVKPE